MFILQIYNFEARWCNFPKSHLYRISRFANFCKVSAVKNRREIQNFTRLQLRI